MLQNSCHSNLKDHWPQIITTNIMITKTVETLWWLFSHSVMSNSSDRMDCSLPGSSVHGILQARILEWVAISFLRGSSCPGIEPGSPTLQADSLPTELWGKPYGNYQNVTQKQASAVGKKTPIDLLSSGLLENFICKNWNAMSEMHHKESTIKWKVCL